MHEEILSEQQRQLFSFLKYFSKTFGLAGGTAIALHMGHRRSIDFDLFSSEPFKNFSLEREVRKFFPIEHVFVNRAGEFTSVVNGVKVTFLEYPFVFGYADMFDDVIKVPDLLTLAALKAFAIGKRAKWKDYVDLYCILRKHHRLKEIADRARKIFGAEFNEKIFRTQLGYFEDIDYSEGIEWMPGYEVPEAEIRNGLREYSLS